MHANKNKTKVRTKLVTAQIKIIVLEINMSFMYQNKNTWPTNLLRETKST